MASQSDFGSDGNSWIRPGESMKVTVLLPDAAQAVAGKLYILGGGWYVTGPDPSPMALALKIEVPWDQANTIHHCKMVLRDDDGEPVELPTIEGAMAPLEIDTGFEVGRPPA